MVGGWKGVGEKTERGIDLVHNKYNTRFLGVLADHMPLFYKIPSSDVLYVEITSFVVGADHLYPAGSGDLPRPLTQGSPHTAHQTLMVLL